MKIKPLSDYLLIELIKKETIAGIVLPDSNEISEYAKVIEVGDGKEVMGKKVPLKVKKGDRIAFNRPGLREIKIKNKDYFFLREEYVVAIVND